VDDDHEFREVILPKVVGQLGGRVLKASNVVEALRISAHHDSASPDPLDLIILDSCMSIAGDARRMVEDADIRTLAMRGRYRLHLCPIVVFTAFPSYSHCALAVKAGADAYIPKRRTADNGEEAVGVSALASECRRILDTQAHRVEVLPCAEWLYTNDDWLRGNFGGQWVAIVDSSTAEDAGLPLDQKCVKDGLMVVSCPSFEDVRRRIISSPALLRDPPSIFMVPCDPVHTEGHTK